MDIPQLSETGAINSALLCVWFHQYSLLQQIYQTCQPNLGRWFVDIQLLYCS